MNAVTAYRTAFSPIRGEPDWWLAQRRDALAVFERTGFPSDRDEPWRLTDLKPLIARAFLPSERSNLAKAAVLAGEAALLVPNAWRFVLADGVFAPALSSLGGLPEGVMLEPTHGRRHAVEPLTSVFPDGIAALGVAFARDGFVLRVPVGLVLEKPIHVISVQTETGGGAHLLSRIDLGEGARAEVIESYAGGAQAWLNASGHITLAAGAQLAHGILVSSSEESQVFSRFTVQVGKAAHYLACPILAGAQQTRLDLRIDLVGDQAIADVKGLYLLSGKQRGQLLTEICHNGLAARTRELVKGIVDDTAHGVFQGKIVVTERGRKSDAHMQNRTLLLSETARADTKPELEIYTDDVKCAHGATIGELDASAVFYLMARGLSQGEARRLLLRAFLEEVAEQIESTSVQAALRAFLTCALGAMAAAA